MSREKPRKNKHRVSTRIASRQCFHRHVPLLTSLTAIPKAGHWENGCALDPVPFTARTRTLTAGKGLGPPLSPTRVDNSPAIVEYATSRGEKTLLEGLKTGNQHT